MLDSTRLHNEPLCPVPLISDDGEFLILVQTGPTFPGASAVLQIYRRAGVFVKDVPFADLWPADKIAAEPIFWTDGTPEWFAGGTFEFTPDQRQLIHKTRWKTTVVINLEDGSMVNR